MLKECIELRDWTEKFKDSLLGINDRLRFILHQWFEGVGCDARRNVTVFVQEIVIIGGGPSVVVTFNVKVRAVVGSGYGSECALGFLFHTSDYRLETKRKRASYVTPSG